MGASNVMVLSTTYESIWFKNKETAIAMLTDAVFQIFYASVMFFTHPFIYRHTESLAVCYGIVSVICAFSVVGALMLAYIDKYAPVYVHTEGEKEVEVYKNFSLKIFGKLGYPLWVLAVSHIFAEGTNVVLTHIICAFLIDRFGFSREVSGYVAGAVPMVASISAIPLGMIIYKCGMKGHISTFYADLSAYKRFPDGNGNDDIHIHA
eukprot:TRINITY_DN1771_c0_g2_i1.p1 TRINITY_DN1771_c0_g2~~TRINITY_DN1771_c0_g2_i1.p1  ORF type:complete len:207 (+),score=29.37 TRINITY_DN1771_c0_g2_i1:638-1258(+)